MNELLEALKAKLGEEVITEELASDLKTQVDVMINEKVQEQLAEKETELEEKNAEEMTEFKDSLVESIDSYIEYAAEEYLKENEIALEAGYKVYAAEKILESIKGVFKEVGLEIPEEEVDRVKEIESELDEKKETLNEKMNEIFEMKRQSFEYEKAVSFMKKTADLSEAKISEVHDLMEGLEYKDIEDFEKKVEFVLEKVNKKSSKNGDDNDDFEELDEEIDHKNNVSSIDKYLSK